MFEMFPSVHLSTLDLRRKKYGLHRSYYRSELVVTSFGIRTKNRTGSIAHMDGSIRILVIAKIDFSTDFCQELMSRVVRMTFASG